MPESTYRSLIDEKIADWENALNKLKDQADKASSDTQAKLSSTIDQFKSAIETAKNKLFELDELETAENTMETKDKIVNIFNSIDEEFKEYEDITPFML